MSDNKEAKMKCQCPDCPERVARTAAGDAGWGPSDDGQLYCPDCIEYSTTPDGEVLCGTHSIPDDIVWGQIMTGAPGSGAPNWVVGQDSSGTRWRREDRGGWTVPELDRGYDDGYDDDDDDEE